VKVPLSVRIKRFGNDIVCLVAGHLDHEARPTSQCPPGCSYCTRCGVSKHQVE
jgi:hypothetical protein